MFRLSLRSPWRLAPYRRIERIDLCGRACPSATVWSFRVRSLGRVVWAGDTATRSSAEGSVSTPAPGAVVAGRSGRARSGGGGYASRMNRAAGLRRARVCGRMYFFWSSCCWLPRRVK